MVEQAQGYAAAPLLRAACEEILWVKYLRKLAPEDAEHLVVLIAQSELNDSLSVQAAYAGPEAMEFLGLSTYFRRSTAVRLRVTADLKALGKKLAWPKRATESGQLPGVSFIARAVGMKREYDFLYHGSSRYVHFSIAELLRRAWGKSGEVTVGSAHFTEYWGAFAAFWGVNLFLNAHNEIAPLLLSEDEIPDTNAEAILKAAKELGEIGQVPLITQEELAWDTEKFVAG
jgi:hypothetical protein